MDIKKQLSDILSKRDIEEPQRIDECIALIEEYKGYRKDKTFKYLCNNGIKLPLEGIESLKAQVLLENGKIQMTVYAVHSKEEDNCPFIYHCESADDNTEWVGQKLKVVSTLNKFLHGSSRNACAEELSYSKTIVDGQYGLDVRKMMGKINPMKKRF